MCHFPWIRPERDFSDSKIFLGSFFRRKKTWDDHAMVFLPETNSEFTPENGWVEYYCPFFFLPVFRCELLVSRRVAWLNKPCDFEDSGVISSFRIGKLHENPYRPVFSLLNRVDMLTATDRKGGGFTPLICEDGPTFRARWCSVKIPPKNWGRLNPAIS